MVASENSAPTTEAFLSLRDPLQLNDLPFAAHDCFARLAVQALLKYLDDMATSTASKEEIVRVVAQFAAEQPAVLAAYLFGSAVQKRLTAESDVDIGLLFETSPEPMRLLELQEDLTTVLKRKSDLVSLNQASPILAMQVLKHGEIVFERSEKAVREFQVRTLFTYFDLKQVRKPIEEALLSS